MTLCNRKRYRKPGHSKDELTQKRPNADVMREFAGHFATGVGVITAVDPLGKRFGLTVNAITSLSVKPPLYLVCLNEDSNTLAAVLKTRLFGINFLRADQQHICNRFAGSGDNKFADIDFAEDYRGVPLLGNCLARAVCSVDHIWPGGDHRIVVGQPTCCQIQGGEPLLYYRGAFLAGKGFASLEKSR